MTSLTKTIRPLFLSGLFALGLAAHALPAHADNHATAVASAASTDQSNGVVNINTATAEELDRLPGVGPSRAQAILELRTKVKRFENIDDLMRVKGIGRASLRKLRPMLTLEGPTTMRTAVHTTRAPSAKAPAAK